MRLPWDWGQDQRWVMECLGKKESPIHCIWVRSSQLSTSSLKHPENFILLESLGEVSSVLSSESTSLLIIDKSLFAHTEVKKSFLALRAFISKSHSWEVQPCSIITYEIILLQPKAVIE